MKNGLILLLLLFSFILPCQAEASGFSQICTSRSNSNATYTYESYGNLKFGLVSISQQYACKYTLHDSGYQGTWNYYTETKCVNGGEPRSLNAAGLPTSCKCPEGQQWHRGEGTTGTLPGYCGEPPPDCDGDGIADADDTDSDCSSCPEGETWGVHNGQAACCPSGTIPTGNVFAPYGSQGGWRPATALPMLSYLNVLR